MYKLEENIFFNELRQASNAASFSLSTGLATELTLIDSMSMNLPLAFADFNDRLGLIDINREHSFNYDSDYLISHSELNIFHVNSRDNAGHFSLDIAALEFYAVHCGRIKSENHHSVNVITAGHGVVFISLQASLHNPGSKNFSFAALNNFGGAFELVQGRIDHNLSITVNGMLQSGTKYEIDNGNVRRFHEDSAASGNKLNLNLLNGHAGTGNDGRNALYNFSFNHAIAGQQIPMAFSFLATNPTNRGVAPSLCEDICVASSLCEEICVAPSLCEVIFPKNMASETDAATPDVCPEGVA
ncbi:MAG: hypothetical protein WC071_07125, partial [Victivallaceae bacterium]